MSTLIISDLHLGSRSSQVGPLAQILDTTFDRLILNGDTINNLNLKKLKSKHWRIVDRLRDIGRRRELVLIRGNHDATPGGEEGAFGPMDVLATLLGVPLREEFRLSVAGRKYLILHGDRFDPTLCWPIITDTADWCYRTVQGVNRKAAKWLKRRVKRLGGAVEFVKRRSVDYARNRGCDGIITGHTHFCDDEWVGGVHYLNTGCWVDWPCTYVVTTPAHIEMRHFNGSLCHGTPRRPVTDVAETPRFGTSIFRSVNGIAPSTN